MSKILFLIVASLWLTACGVRYSSQCDAGAVLCGFAGAIDAGVLGAMPRPDSANYENDVYNDESGYVVDHPYYGLVAGHRREVEVRQNFNACWGPTCGYYRYGYP